MLTKKDFQVANIDHISDFILEETREIMSRYLYYDINRTMFYRIEFDLFKEINKMLSNKLSLYVYIKEMSKNAIKS